MSQGKKKNLKAEDLVKQIKSNPKIVFFSDVARLADCALSTLYVYFPVTSEGYKDINDALEGNRTNMKESVRDRLLESNSPSSLIFLYKLLTTDIQEKKILSDRFETEDRKEDDDKEIQLEIN